MSGADNLMTDTQADNDRTWLAAGCFVCEPADLPHINHDGWQQAMLAGPATGGSSLAQYRVTVAKNATAIRRFDDSDCLLFVLAGHGVAEIGDRRFTITPSETEEYVFWIGTGPGVTTDLFIDSVEIRPEN